MVNDVAVWVAVFVLGLLCLNWPLLGMFHDDPFVYLLIIWLFFMLLVGRIASGGKAPPAL